MRYSFHYGTIHLYRFDSVHEMVQESVKAYDEKRTTEWGRQRTSRTMDSRYTGRSEICTVRDGARLAEQEWKQGLEMADRLFEKVRHHEFPKPKNIRRRGTWNEDHGDDLSIDRLRSGQPYWRSTERTAQPGPVNVTIVVNCGATQAWSSEMITWRGVAAVVLAELLEEAGYRVEIIGARVGYESYADDTHNAWAVTLKSPSELIDRSTLINATSGWFYRTIGMLVNAIGQPSQKLTSSNGSSISVSYVQSLITTDKKVFTADYLYDETSAVSWITGELEKFNAPPPQPVFADSEKKDSTSQESKVPEKPKTQKQLAEERKEEERRRKEAKKNRITD